MANLQEQLFIGANFARRVLTYPTDLAPSAISFHIVFGEADPPLTKTRVERVVLNALASAVGVDALDYSAAKSES